MEHTLDSQSMKSAEALAQMNLRVSEIREVLTGLEETETAYLEAREKKAMERIREVVDESKGLLAQVKSDYEEVEELIEAASSFVEYLTKARVSFDVVLEDFKRKSDAWEVDFAAQKEEIAESMKALSVSQVKLRNDRESIKSQLKDLEARTAVIRDREGVVDRNTQRVVKQESEVHMQLELIKVKDAQLTERQNALTAKDAQLTNREKTIKDNERSQDERERALVDKYATLQKTLKEIND